MFYTYILKSLFEKFEKNHLILCFASRDCKVTSFGRVELSPFGKLELAMALVHWQRRECLFFAFEHVLFKHVLLNMFKASPIKTKKPLAQSHKA